jgi:hypothetical protein
MTKKTKSTVILVSVLSLIVGIGLTAWGFYVNLQIGMIANSFMGQMAMVSGQMSRNNVANQLAAAKTYMTVGGLITVISIIFLLVGIFWKKSEPAP